MIRNRVCLLGILAAAGLAGAPGMAVAAPADGDWLYNGGPSGDHYSPLTQITPENVARLKEAWRYAMPNGGLESQPMMIGHTLYVLTTDRQVAALDAVTGQQKWLFDPKLAGHQPIRGLSAWRDGNRLRIVFGRENFLYLLDAETGQPVSGFGDNGHIDVRANLRGRAEENAIYLTSPVAVYRNLLIVNGREAENTPASPGDVRAFDAHTGKLVWTFHTIPHPGEEGADTWPRDAWQTQGGANAWSGATVDVERGIVFVNTGSAADDFYGADRLGDNRFASSTIALDAGTGRRIWDFQLVHHDLWDSDSTSAPILSQVTHGGRKIDAVIVTNKQSYIYVFDRVSGKPLFPIEERPVPASTVPGEVASATQPVPVLPRPLSRKPITVDDLTGRSPQANAEARKLFAGLNGAGGAFVPLALDRDTLVVPGFSGGNEWGGMAMDRKGVLYAEAADGASMTRLELNARLQPGHVDNKPAAGGDQNGYPSLKYAFTGYGRFRLADGSPALGEPQATLNAVDLNTGQYRWRIPFEPSSNGGPAVTQSGLLFLGSSGSLQAFDTKDGKLLWQQKLPANSGMTPAIYEVDGREYVVLASAGRGDPAYVAYAVPD
jgi:quinoprotein glucose dehydrogenase